MMIATNIIAPKPVLNNGLGVMWYGLQQLWVDEDSKRQAWKPFNPWPESNNEDGWGTEPPKRSWELRSK